MSSLNKGRSKYRFNIVDILLLLVIIVSVAGMLFLYFFDGNVDGEEKKDNSVDIIFTLSQTEIPDILRGKVNIGDSVTVNDGNVLLGEVTDTEYTDSVYTRFDSENNASVDEVYPDECKIDVKIRVRIIAEKGDDGLYRINGYILSPGKVMDIRFPYYTGKMVCTSISEVNE